MPPLTTRLKNTPLAPYITLALTIFAIYANIYNNTFLFDDGSLIQSNTYLQDWRHIWPLLTGSTTSGAHLPNGFYRPLQILLYLFMFQLGAGTTFTFHLLNISLHTANTCLVYRLGKKLNFNPRGVFFAALLWGVHPLHTEAITYMSATADPLFTFFCLSSLAILVPKITQRAIYKIIPLFLLALLSKETAVMLPLLVMTCIFLISERRLDPKTYLRTWPLWIITFAFIALRLNAKNFVGAQESYIPHDAIQTLYADHITDRILTFLATLPAYLELLVWPHALHMERIFTLATDPWQPLVMMGAGLIALAATQIIRTAKHPTRGIETSWGLFWFAAAHAPDTGILFPINSIFLEHWMYLPSIGLFLGLSETLAKFLQNRRQAAQATCAAAITCAALLSYKTWIQNEIWHDPVSFYNNIFTCGENSARAHGNLATYYLLNGDNNTALDHFKKAVAISDTFAETRQNMAATYFRLPNHTQDAIDNLTRALEIDPNFYRAAEALGNLYALQGDTPKATYYHTRAAEMLAHEK